MSEKISTSADVTRAISAAIFASEGNVGVEVLVLRTLDRGLADAADALGLEIVDRSEELTPSELRPLVSRLFDEDEDEIGGFLDQIVYTRQIPIEQSPIENWSLTELWTRLQGLVGGAGFAYMAGASPLVLVIAGAFGTLLMRPLTAVSKGVAAGLEEPVRDATEGFAREWLGRHSEPKPTAEPTHPPTTSERPRAPRRELTPEESQERQKRQLERGMRDTEKEMDALLGGIPAYLEAVRQEIVMRGETEAANEYAVLMGEVEAELRKLKPSGEPIQWPVTPEVVVALNGLLAGVKPLALAARGGGMARYRHNNVLNMVNRLEVMYSRFELLRNMRD